MRRFKVILGGDGGWGVSMPAMPPEADWVRARFFRYSRVYDRREGFFWPYNVDQRMFQMDQKASKGSPSRYMLL